MQLVFRRLALVFGEKWYRRHGDGDLLRQSKELWERVLSNFSTHAVEKAVEDIETGVEVFSYDAPNVGQFAAIVRKHFKPVRMRISESEREEIEREIKSLERRIQKLYELSNNVDYYLAVDNYKKIRRLYSVVAEKQVKLMRGGES